jgi:hypothetical protein
MKSAESDAALEGRKPDRGNGPGASAALGQRLHHGLTGVALAAVGLARLAAGRTDASRAIAWTLAGGFLMAHDWKDRSAWFRRGAQAD